jgi:hypothetical protein
MTIPWEKALSLFQDWKTSKTLLVAHSTLSEWSGRFEVVVSDVFADDNSFVIRMRRPSGEQVEAGEEETILDLTGSTFSVTEPTATLIEPVLLFASRLKGEAVSFAIRLRD